MSENNTPILVGISQLLQRVEDFREAKEPIELMSEALTQAAEDTGNPQILQEVGSIRVIKGVWPYEDPGSHLAEQHGLNGIETGITIFGGNGVQMTLNLSCVDIQAGKFNAVALVGAECGNTQAKAQKAHVRDLGWTHIPGEPTWTIPTSGLGRHELESSRGLGGASQMYAIIENALRYENRRSIHAHSVHLSELWSRFNDVAQGNPSAWIRERVSAEEIRTEGPQNRPIAFPYPKFMNANNRVDMGSALLLCSVELANKMGIPEDRWIYPWCGTDAHDTTFISNRACLTQAPGFRQASQQLLETTDLNVNEIDFIDLYSCFPSAVQVAAKELGLSLDKPLTVTGGLTFGGGPLNDYVMHAIARMAELLRENPGKTGLITANGGILTKHSHCVYSADPPTHPFQRIDVQEMVDTSQDRDVDDSPTKPVVVDGYTVMYGRDQAVRLVASALTTEGKRTWAYSTDPALMAAVQQEEFCGTNIQVNTTGELQPV